MAETPSEPIKASSVSASEASLPASDSPSAIPRSRGSLGWLDLMLTALTTTSLGLVCGTVIFYIVAIAKIIAGRPIELIICVSAVAALFLLIRLAKWLYKGSVPTANVPKSGRSVATKLTMGVILLGMAIGLIMLALWHVDHIAKLKQSLEWQRQFQRKE